MKKVAIGIDVGGTNTAIGVVDSDGKVLVKDSIPTPDHGNITLFIDDITNSVRELVNAVGSLNPKAEILGLGIGAPNANYYTGNIEHAPNLSFKGVIPMVKLLEENFPEMKAVAITNDANAAAIGEMIYGGARGMKNFVVYTLGTGVGSGIVVNGDLVLRTRWFCRRMRPYYHCKQRQALRLRWQRSFGGLLLGIGHEADRF